MAGDIYKHIVTQKTIDRLREHRLFFERLGAPRFKVDDVLRFHARARMEPYSMLYDGLDLFSMGAFSYTKSALPLEAEMGRYSSIAEGVGVLGTNHPLDRVTTSNVTYTSRPANIAAALADAKAKPAEVPIPRQVIAPRIGHDVWIGGDVLLGHNVRIGNGSVVAARAVVTRDVPDYAVVAGVPARVIKMRFPPEIVARLQKVRWWRYSLVKLQKLGLGEPVEPFLDALERAIDDRRIRRWNPKPPRLLRILGSGG